MTDLGCFFASFSSQQSRREHLKVALFSLPGSDRECYQSWSSSAGNSVIFRKLSDNFIKITIKLLCISVKHGISQLAYLDLVPAFNIVLGEGLSACFLSEGNKYREKAIMN